MGKIMNNNIYPNLKGVTGAGSTNIYPDYGSIERKMEEIRKGYEYYNSLSDEELIEKIKLESLCFKYIINPSYKVCKAALETNGSLIKFIDDPSEELQLLAINEGFNPDNILFLLSIKNPTINTINKCIEIAYKAGRYNFIWLIQKYLKNINVEDLCIEGIKMLIYSGLEEYYLDEKFKKSLKYKQAFIELEV